MLLLAAYYKCCKTFDHEKHGKIGGEKSAPTDDDPEMDGSYHTDAAGDAAADTRRDEAAQAAAAAKWDGQRMETKEEMDDSFVSFRETICGEPDPAANENDITLQVGDEA